MRDKTTHRRYIWPFARAENAFSSCALRIDSSDDFDPKEDSFVLDADDASEQSELDLELKLAVDAEAIIENAKLNADDIEVRLVVEQPYARLVCVEESWTLATVPSDHSLSFAPGSYSDRRILVRLVAALARNLPKPSGNTNRAWRRGSVLAERVFKLSKPMAPSLFPVANTSFSARDWEERALWYVEFDDIGSAHQLPPQEVVTVHLNADLPALQMLWKSTATRGSKQQRITAHMVRYLITAEILGELCVGVLGEFSRLIDADSTVEYEEDSLCERLLRFLSSKLSESEESLFDMATRSPGLLRRKIQAAVTAGRAFDMNAFEELQEAS